MLFYIVVQSSGRPVGATDIHVREFDSISDMVNHFNGLNAAIMNQFVIE